jgi:hypothetical protein
MFVRELVLWNLLQVYLAALRWTISSLLMLDLVWGSQTQLLYSNFGRMKDVYAFSFTFCASIQSLLIYLYTGFVVMAFYVCFALIFIWRIINEYLLTITVVITISVTFLCTDYACFFARSAFLNLILHNWQSYIFISLIWILFQRFIYSVKVSNFSLQCGTLQFSPIGFTSLQNGQSWPKSGLILH